MRLLIVACCVLAVSVALFLYQGQQSKQRISNLPNLPEPTVSVEEPVNDSAAIAVKNRWLSDAGAEPWSDSSIPDEQFTLGEGEMRSLEEEECCPEENEVTPYSVNDKPDGDKGENKRPRSRREQLIAKHGDTPFVRSYLAVREKFFRKEPLTFEEHMVFLQGLAKFTSSPRNKETYERMKANLAGSDPASFQMTYDD